MRSLSIILMSILSTSALALQSPSLFHISPTPFHSGTWGPCGIACRQMDMYREFPPDSCVSGTFVSADIQVLGQRGVRVDPNAEFWPHNGWDQSRESLSMPHNPWNIDPMVIRAVLDGVPKELTDDIVSRVGRTSDFQVYYTGADLIASFGFQPCAST